MIRTPFWISKRLMKQALRVKARPQDTAVTGEELQDMEGAFGG